VNTKVEVLEKANNGWVKIRYSNGKTGYAYGNYISGQPTVAAVNKPAAADDTAQKNKLIEDALWKVSAGLNNKRDMNGNGKSNCEDAAIMFYMYYAGDKKDVRIMVNNNAKTDMNHAFNSVMINGVWRTIEPQAYNANWGSRHIYFMQDIWGKQYDASLDKDAWAQYGRFVK
jgi:uncharacterized protein YgiM (DUF1202 family)